MPKAGRPSPVLENDRQRRHTNLPLARKIYDDLGPLTEVEVRRVSGWAESGQERYLQSIYGHLGRIVAVQELARIKRELGLQ